MVRFGLWVVLGFGSLAVLLGACVSSEVTQTGPKQAAKPEGCEVTIFPSTTPDHEWTDLATAESRCHFSMGRTACIDELREKVCETGGDTLYGLKDGRQGEDIIVIGTIALKTGSNREKSGETSPHEPVGGEKATAGTCDPPCSPGYACKEGQCAAVCNPPCGPGSRCNQQRSCEPIAATTSAAEEQPTKP